MKFDIEVLLKGSDDVVVETVSYEASEASAWTDDDVGEVLRLALRRFYKAQNPDGDERAVSLRGLSWIVTPVKGGVAIAIEIQSGAVVAGPFDAEADLLTQAIGRVIGAATSSGSLVH
jgi:hypothetical protein